MEVLLRTRSEVVLICIIVSVYTLISVSKGALTDQLLVRAKRQSPFDDNNVTADVSSTDSDVPAQPIILVMDTQIAAGNIESSPASDVLVESSVAGTEMATSYIVDAPSLSVIDQTHLSTALWPSNTDTTLTLQQSNYLSIDSTFIFQTMAVLPSDLVSVHSYDFVEATSVLSDSLSLSSTFFDNSHSDFPSSNISFVDVSTTVLQEDMFSSNFVDKSTIDLHWDSFSSDSNILSESSAVVNFDILSSDFSFTNDFSIVLPTDVLLTDGNKLSMSATDFLEESLISGDVSAPLPTTGPNTLETTSLIWETSELSLGTTESFGSMMFESKNLEQSSTNVDYSESLTPNLDLSSLPWDVSELASSESVMTVTSWLDGATATPATTSDMLTSLTTILEHVTATMIWETWELSVATTDATTMITQTDTATYPIKIPTSIQVTSSVSDSLSSSSITGTTIPVTTTANNISGSLPTKSTQTDDEALTTGGKIAIGILIPVAIICLVLFSLFFYRRYRLNHQSSKAFMHPSVRYRTYSNAAYKDEEIAMDGTWRSNH